MVLEVNDIEANLTLKKQGKIVPKCEGFTSDPGTGDDVNDGWDVGDLWVNTTSKEGFLCLNNTASAAVWKSTTSSSGTTTIVKSADESVTSSTTIQDDDELKFSVLNGESKSFVFSLVVSEAGANPNIKISLAALSGLTGTIEYQWYKIGTNSTGGASDFTTTSASISLDTMKSLTLVIGSLTATADGDLVLKWAQGSSDADATTIHKHSTLVVNKV